MKLKKIMYIAIFFISFIMPIGALAENFVQPIIQGKVYNTWTVNPKRFGQPVHMLKGGEDECNGGYFPDQYQFKNFSVLSDGQIYEVYLTHTNGLFFHNERISASTSLSTSPSLNKAQFMKKFKKHVRIDSENPNILHADASEDSHNSISFTFKNNQLLKYRLDVDNC